MRTDNSLSRFDEGMGSNPLQFFDSWKDSKIEWNDSYGDKDHGTTIPFY